MLDTADIVRERDFLPLVRYNPPLPGLLKMNIARIFHEGTLLLRPAMASLQVLRIAALLLGVVVPTSSILLIGCGDSPVTYFPSKIGQKWDMVADETGDITHFEIVNPPTSDHADSVNIHITKTQTRAYWQEDSAGAELWWGMHQLSDRRWVADYSIANFDPPNLMRFDYLHSDSNSYMVIPPPGAAAGDYYGYSQDTWCGGDSYCQIPWVKVMWLARISYPTVDTPVYKGPALLNEEYECAQPIDLSEISNPQKCAHELWYFAPNIGLVEIAPEWVAVPCDPTCPSGTPLPPIPPPIRRIN